MEKFAWLWNPTWLITHPFWNCVHRKLFQHCFWYRVFCTLCTTWYFHGSNYCLINKHVFLQYENIIFKAYCFYYHEWTLSKSVWKNKKVTKNTHTGESEAIWQAELHHIFLIISSFCYFKINTHTQKSCYHDFNFGEFACYKLRFNT